MALKILTVGWLVFMLILSHIPGGPSTAESRWLSDMTGVKERTLRQMMHVFLYAVLGVMVTLAWPDTPVWSRAAALAITAVVDEWSKALPLFPGRHCSIWPDMVLNLVGALKDPEARQSERNPGLSAVRDRLMLLSAKQRFRQDGF